MHNRPVVGPLARLSGIKQLVRDGQPINENARKFLAEHSKPKDYKVDGDHMDDDDKWKAIAHIKSKVDAIYKKLDNEKTESWLRS